MAKKGSKAYELEIKIAGAVAKSLGTSVAKVEKHFNRIKKAGEISGKAIKATGKIAGAGLAALATGAATGAVAAGKYLYDLGSKFDDAADTIRIGTGATGKDLEALNESMKNVYATVPADMADTATAISDYNTRLGVTGKTLETLSTQALQASEILNEDLGTMIEGSSQAFQQWGVAETEMADKMDYIFKVSQSTGIGMNDLFGKMQQYGPQLQDLGYSFEEAAALMGQMEKAGVNTDEALAAMKKSVGALAKEGIGASEGLQMYYEKIQKAGSEAEAAAIANEVFGARAGSTMAAAIRDGTLAVDDFVKSLEANGETISGAAWDTYDFAEKFEIMKHEAEIALAPLADTIFNALSDVLPVLGTLLENLSPIITDVLGAIDLSMISDLANQLIPILSDTIATIAPILAQILPPVLNVASTLASMLLPVIGDLISGVLPAIVPLLDPLLQVILTLAPVLESIAPCVTVLAQVLSSVLVAAIETSMPIVQGLTTVLTGVLDFITNIFTGNFSAAIENLVQIFSGVWQTLKAAFVQPINFIIRGLNAFIGYLNKLTIPDWVPGVGGKGLNFSLIPEIALAEGGIAMGPTNALIGEGGEPEAVVPLSKLPTLLRDEDDDDKPKKPRGGGGGDGSVVIYATFAPVIHCNGGDEGRISEIMNDEYERFKEFMDQYIHEYDRTKL